MNSKFPSRLKLENLSPEERQHFESLSPRDKRIWESLYNANECEKELRAIRLSRQRRRQLARSSKQAALIVPASPNTSGTS